TAAKPLPHPESGRSTAGGPASASPPIRGDLVPVPCVERPPPAFSAHLCFHLKEKMEDSSSSPVLHFQTAIVLVARKFPDQREQRQVHGNYDAADHYTQEYDHDRFQCR